MITAAWHCITDITGNWSGRWCELSYTTSCICSTAAAASTAAAVSYSTETTSSLYWSHYQAA